MNNWKKKFIIIWSGQLFVDRWNRKWTMIGADSFVALCSGIIALLFYLDIVELWQIYLLLALRSMGGAFHSPAMISSYF